MEYKYSYFDKCLHNLPKITVAQKRDLLTYIKPNGEMLLPFFNYLNTEVGVPVGVTTELYNNLFKWRFLDSDDMKFDKTNFRLILSNLGFQFYEYEKALLCEEDYVYQTRFGYKKGCPSYEHHIVEKKRKDVAENDYIFEELGPDEGSSVQNYKTLADAIFLANVKFERIRFINVPQIELDEYLEERENPHKDSFEID